MNRLSTRGFTLLEILVALAIFALISAFSFRGLSLILDTRTRVTQETRKWQDLSRLSVRLQQDLSSVINRPIRNNGGTEIACFTGDANPIGEDAPLFAFTRLGLPGQTDKSQNLQRVGYRLRGTTLEMLSWTHLDQGMYERPVVDELLTGLASLNVQYLDAGNAWQNNWPMRYQSSLPPRAVKLTLVLTTGEKIIWQLFVQ